MFIKKNIINMFDFRGSTLTPLSYKERGWGRGSQHPVKSQINMLVQDVSQFFPLCPLRLCGKIS
jgi:hypothetical protein